MIAWNKQAEAWVGQLCLGDGRGVNVVVVGPRRNPRGAAIVFPAEGKGALAAIPLADALDQLTPEQVVDILCMQERAYGDSGLAAPEST